MPDLDNLVEVKLLVYLKCIDGEILRPDIYYPPFRKELIREVLEGRKGRKTVEATFSTAPTPPPPKPGVVKPVRRNK